MVLQLNYKKAGVTISRTKTVEMNSLSEKLSGKTALVTGGAGFIGSHLVDRLRKDQMVVRMPGYLSTGRQINLARHTDSPDFMFVKGSILDKSAVKKAVGLPGNLFSTDILPHTSSDKASVKVFQGSSNGKDGS